MNEKTYQKFSKLESSQKHEELPQVIADGVRQLTRLADQGDEIANEKLRKARDIGKTGVK